MTKLSIVGYAFQLLSIIIVMVSFFMKGNYIEAIILFLWFIIGILNGISVGILIINRKNKELLEENCLIFLSEEIKKRGRKND